MSTAATSPTRQDASRRNGAKSNGPVTDAGKARSARNATKHGLTGGPVILPHESQEQYDELKRELGQLYRATSPAEWNLIDEMAASRWRLNRIEFIETAILNQAYERLMDEIASETEEDNQQDIDPDKVMAMAFADVAENSKGFRMLDRHQRTLWNSYDRALQQLQSLQEIRAAEAMQATRQAQIATRQNEPRRPAGYSSLPPASSYPRGPEFMKAALSQLEKQNTVLMGTGGEARRSNAA